MVAFAPDATGNPSALESFFDAIKRNSVEILFTVPAVVATIRGRQYLKTILLGRLSLVGMLGVGVGLAFTSVLFSTDIGLVYFRWPALDLAGFWDASEATPISLYILGPLGEEMFYQVGLQTWLQRFGPIAAVLGSTAPFWGSHLFGGFVPMHDALIFLLPSMLIFALIRQTTKSFGAAVLAHSTYNVFVSCLSFTPR